MYCIDCPVAYNYLNVRPQEYLFGARIFKWLARRQTRVPKRKTKLLKVPMYSNQYVQNPVEQMASLTPF